VRVLFVFLDGVGLGDDDASINPFVTAHLPVLDALFDGVRPLRANTPLHTARASLVGIDATLGMAGTPQSGTGQAALLTGIDAVALHGRHFGPWVPAGLRPLVRDQSVLVRAQAAALSVAFANAYPEEVLDAMRGEATSLPNDAPTHRRRRSGAAFLRAGPPLAALGANVLNRHTAELAAGDAVASEITNDGWREHLLRDVPVIDAAHAGRNLVRIAVQHDLTLFAHYATDYAGHADDRKAMEFALERVDAFFGGIFDDMPEDMLLVVASDHGNIEDTRGGHTRNPAFGLVAGDGHEQWAGALQSLTDVTPMILAALEVE
jgi:hypothetical protein